MEKKIAVVGDQTELESGEVEGQTEIHERGGRKRETVMRQALRCLQGRREGRREGLRTMLVSFHFCLSV